jgi:hypothetical protein
MTLSDHKNQKLLIEDSFEIDKLMNKFKGTRTIIDFEVGGKFYQGTFKEVTDITTTIHFKGKIIENTTFVEVNITSGLTIYNFRSSILDLQDNELVISTPTVMRTLVKRKYKRVDLNESDEATLEFTVASGDASQKTSGKVSPKYAQIHQELSKKIPDIKKIVQLIYAQLKTYADEFEIELYREKKKTLPVQIIKELKETYYVKDIKERRAYMTTHSLPKVVCLGTYLKYLNEKGQSQDDIKKIMLSAFAEDQKKKIRAFMYSPITLFGDVIGHIYVGNFKSEFNDQDVFITINMAEIISEAFVKTKLFQLEEKGAIKGKIINLSGGGSLIEVNDQYVIKFIKSGTKLKTVLSLKDVSGKFHKFNCSAKVIRLETIEGTIHIGIKFMEMRWNEHDIIDKYVRKKIEFNNAMNGNNN